VIEILDLVIIFLPPRFSKEKVNFHRRLQKRVLPHISLVIHQPGYWKCHVDHRATWFQLALVVCAPVTAAVLHQMNSLSLSSEIGNPARDGNLDVLGLVWGC
jgi:hypothetical protein